MAKDRTARGSDRVQMVGSEADLMNGPDDMRNSAFSGGEVQMVGSEAVISRRTTPMGSFDGEYSKNIGKSGSLEIIGSEVEFNRTPVRGFESYPTPISQNSETPGESISGYPRTAGKYGR
jgi:hypothetical protein